MIENMEITKKGKSGMNPLESCKTLSMEERKLILSLIKKYSKEEIQLAIRHLTRER